ncbi:MAG: uroporphyrinogen-III synthase [Pseudotabrizicola sp.]|uniref:uroporphyrinogen-III synthase n=1 Tax=Pseudotabrizicola sp. TaxID=2939647 RepID=UPI00271D2CF3|nr:uroporphyrinogen-III synthase [Pseudotabrizicola sp.]MDO9639175.1 uroporphyrinogen-III synthase [Pseudotabrizicola sp.]
MLSQSRALPVLITRPEPQASRFASALRDRYGNRVDPVLTPLLEPSFLTPDLRGMSFRSVVLTSETGARAAAALAGLPAQAFCVGDRTAEVATDLGFQAISAKGDAGDLFHLVRTQPEHAPFLHLRGQDTRGDLVARLAGAGLRAHDAVVYVQQPVALSQDAVRVLSAGGPVIVPLFSPRTATLFRAALQSEIPDETVLSRLRIIAFSAAVAETFTDCQAGHLAIAAAPTLAELFLALDRFIFTA